MIFDKIELKLESKQYNTCKVYLIIKNAKESMVIYEGDTE